MPLGPGLVPGLQHTGESREEESVGLRSRCGDMQMWMSDSGAQYDFISIGKRRAVQLVRAGEREMVNCGPLWGSARTEIAEVGLVSYAKPSQSYSGSINRFTFDARRVRGSRYRLSISIRMQISVRVPIVLPQPQSLLLR